MTRDEGTSPADTGLLPPWTMSVADLSARIGGEIGLSDWHAVTQAQIDGFAEVTGDDQFIHVDPVRAAAEAPFGGTIAHGFLSLSLLSLFGREALPVVTGRRMAINYGLERVRFLSPVRAGARVRGRFVLTGLEPHGEAQVLLRWGITVEIEGGIKPALVAEWLVLSVLG